MKFNDILKAFEGKVFLFIGDLNCGDYFAGILENEKIIEVGITQISCKDVGDESEGVEISSYEVDTSKRKKVRADAGDIVLTRNDNGDVSIGIQCWGAYGYEGIVYYGDEIVNREFTLEVPYN